MKSRPANTSTIASQSTGLSVSFNDGVETKSLVLNRGTTYALYWNAGLSRWAIAPYDEVARRPAAFVRVSLRPQSLTAVELLLPRF